MRTAPSAAWRSCDNGNGYVSLSEFDGWIKAEIAARVDVADADRIWRLYRPIYLQAHGDAADTLLDQKVKGCRTATTDDDIERKEFRLAVAHLLIYAAMFDAFSCIDLGGEGPDALLDGETAVLHGCAPNVHLRGLGRGPNRGPKRPPAASGGAHMLFHSGAQN